MALMVPLPQFRLKHYRRSGRRVCTSGLVHYQHVADLVFCNLARSSHYTHHNRVVTCLWCLTGYEGQRT